MPKNFYPLLIFTLLGSFLLFSGWSAYRAATRGSQVTDRDYYSKGLKYNSTMVEKRASSVQGWHLTTTLSGKQLQISLLDGKGVPVSGANGQLVFFLQTEAATTTLVLAEATPGNYLVLLPTSLRGEIAARVDFEHQGARLNRQLLLNI
jgi:nitrogen fixation protein FixH